MALAERDDVVCRSWASSENSMACSGPFCDLPYRGVVFVLTKSRLVYFDSSVVTVFAQVVFQEPGALGIRFASNFESGGSVIIESVRAASMASRCGRLREGMELLAVNGRPTSGRCVVCGMCVVSVSMFFSCYDMACARWNLYAGDWTRCLARSQQLHGRCL
jgi:hypothetical protein